MGSGSSNITGDSELTLIDGQGRFVFAAPGSPGWVALELLLDETAVDYPLPFLRDDLDDDGAYDNDPPTPAPPSACSTAAQIAFCCAR